MLIGTYGISGEGENIWKYPVLKCSSFYQPWGQDIKNINNGKGHRKIPMQKEG
jgi:hypothetical protein